MTNRRNKSTKYYIALAALAVIGLAALYYWPRLPADVRLVLNNAETFELYSLNPDYEVQRKALEANDPNLFRDWPVLGKITVTDSGTRAKLVSALAWGTTDGPRLASRACFSPRHGIRATYQGRTVDLVICFECYRVRTYGENEIEISTTDIPGSVFSDVLRNANVPLAKAPHER